MHNVRLTRLRALQSKEQGGLANRIYIAIGLIAILILGAAFLVPRLIDWNAYKPRMEQMAAEALGVEVEIAGDMDFTLLPQPRLHFEDARLGPADAPVGAARTVEADFSLMDFLRDRFTVTQLRLIEPQLNLVIGEDGELQTNIALAENPSVSNVSVANARFEDGTLRLTDLRSGQSWQAEQFTGDMRLSAIRGPFTLEGRASHEGSVYTLRVGTSAMGSTGDIQVSGFVRPVDGRFSVSVDGLVQTGTSPRLTGALTYRQASAAQEDAAVGGLLLQSPITADMGAVELSEFTLLPDENQTAARLTGQAVVTLGAEPSFDADVSGGVVTLLPNALSEEGPQPFEVVRLLRGMPEPLVPPLPGRLTMSINELVLRGVAVREVRLDARSDGELWDVEDFSGRLAGDTALRLSGTLGRAAGWPAFEGTLEMASSRLDALSLLWKRPGEGNPLFGMAGALNGQLQLVNDRLRLSEGELVLDGTTHDVSVTMRFGETPSLAVAAGLSRLNARQSTALMALFPPIDPAGAFGLSFPEGRLDLDLEAARLADQPLEDLSLRSAWGAGAITVESLDLASFGGVGFSGEGRISGSLAVPVIAANGEMNVARGASALELILGGNGSPNPLRSAISGSLPARLEVALEQPGSDGVQRMTLEGDAGVAGISLGLEMAGGITALGREPLAVTLEAVADSGAAMLEQLGLAPIIVGEDGAIASARLEGNPRGAMEAELSLEGDGERLDFTGTLLLSDLASIRGEGQTSFLFADGAALAELAGAQGVWFPSLEGQAEIGFVGDQNVRISNLSAFMDDREVTGELVYSTQRNTRIVGGSLAFDALDVQNLASMLGGAASSLNLMPGVWPDGPIDLGGASRRTRGRIAVTTPVLVAGAEPLVEAVAFDYAWGQDDVGLRGMFGEFGGGTVQLEATACCASVLPDKSLSGRLTLNGVALDSILPATPADALSGRLTLGLQFQGSGGSYRDFAASLNGEGSFSVEDLRIEGLSPAAFSAAAEVDNLVEIEPEALETLVATALDSGPFAADEAGGLISLVGGSARISNIAVEGDGARLVGGGRLSVETAALDANWTLALTRALAGNGLITETTGRIGVGVGGPLFAPNRSLDLGPMVDAIQMQAYELELDELEALRAQQEARQRAAAEEQARLMEEEARRQAEALLEQQRHEAERLELEAEQRRLEEIEAQLSRQSPEPQVPAAPAPTAPAPNNSITVLPPGALELEFLGR